MLKKQLVRQCLTDLGVGVSFGDAKKWFQKNHKLSLADATFYHVRKLMKNERDTELGIIKPKPLSVVDAVKQVRELIDKLGRDEVRKLIDLL